MSREGDIVLIHFKDQPALYARIEAIEPDIKKDWYRVTLLLLTIPQQIITWILRDEYINGAPFTMDGNQVMMKEIKKVAVAPGINSSGSAKSVENRGKVVPFKINPK